MDSSMQKTDHIFLLNICVGVRAARYFAVISYTIHAPIYGTVY